MVVTRRGKWMKIFLKFFPLPHHKKPDTLFEIKELA